MVLNYIKCIEHRCWQLGVEFWKEYRYIIYNVLFSLGNYSFFLDPGKALLGSLYKSVCLSGNTGFFFNFFFGIPVP